MRRFGRSEGPALRAWSKYSGVALRPTTAVQKGGRRFFIIIVSFRVFRGQECLGTIHVPVPDCDLAAAS
jgi:hypothetical protein